jgi:formylmethanofuran dehydrogenase subunit C
VEAEVISPDKVAGKTLKQVKALTIYHGNKKQSLSDHFDIEGDVAEKASEQKLVIEGSVPHVKYIGAGMSSGEVLIKGDAGMHTGAQMKGGRLTINGNTNDWSGAEMSGGLLRVKGDAGHLLGAAYRGSSEGMTGGAIVVDGNAGSEAASFIRRGMIVIKGNTAPFTGVHMNGGQIFILGKTGKRAGAQAKGNGGFIACLGGLDELLPTYIYDTTYKPTMMKLYLKELSEKLDVKEAYRYKEVQLLRYRGDLAVGGNAEILITK